MTTRNPRNMIKESERLKSFSNWIYRKDSSVSCTAEKMAKAGFYMISDDEPDTVKCFVCMKQLDGWEKEDDPFIEHKKHASYCPFVKFGKEEKDLTLLEYLSLSEEMETKLLELKHQDDIKQLEKLREQLVKKLAQKDTESKRS
ncbi:baculoviral IAP repeat-containing protein 5.2-A-like [Planococcus citri]|uniref:baculoviral IAP repeat-containing protein 5.2-A-like n=1 Tax=Planococcus citri TaxID=170843 RepID=UPI0031F8349A